MSEAQTTQERLDQADKKVKEETFRKNVGLGNEIGYYVFDYPAKDELIVREWLRYMKNKNNPTYDGYELIIFDLYDIMIDILEQEGVLEQCYEFEKRRGIERVTTAVGRLSKLSDDSGGLIADYIKEHTPGNASAFVEGNSLYIKVDDLNQSIRVQSDKQMKVADNPKFLKAKKGSTVFPKRGAAIMTNKVRIINDDSYMDTNMMALEPDDIDGDFLYTFISRTGLYKIADTSTLTDR